MSKPCFLAEAEAASYLGLAPRTLSRWRWSGKGPAFRKFGGAVRYALTDLDAFAGQSVVKSGEA